MEDVVGGSSSGALASKGKRVASDIIDLLLVPIVIGFLVALVLFRIPELPRNIVLVVINVFWMLFRDMVFSPGRKMVGLKLVSLVGEKITITQALIRNVLLVVPFLLLVGYILETVMILTKGERLEDGWAKTRVVAA